MRHNLLENYNNKPLSVVAMRLKTGILLAVCYYILIMTTITWLPWYRRISLQCLLPSADDSVTQLTALLEDSGVPLMDVDNGQWLTRLLVEACEKTQSSDALCMYIYCTVSINFPYRSLIRSMVNKSSLSFCYQETLT